MTTLTVTWSHATTLGASDSARSATVLLHTQDPILSGATVRTAVKAVPITVTPGVAASRDFSPGIYTVQLLEDGQPVYDYPLPRVTVPTSGSVTLVSLLLDAKAGQPLPGAYTSTASDPNVAALVGTNGTQTKAAVDAAIAAKVNASVASVVSDAISAQVPGIVDSRLPKRYTAEAYDVPRDATSGPKTTANLQKLINESTVAGQVAYIGPGRYLLTRPGSAQHALTLPTGAYVQAHPLATFVYDTGSNLAPANRTFHMVSVGTWSTPATDVTWNGGSLVGNTSKASGAYIGGIGAACNLDATAWTASGFEFPAGADMWPDQWSDIRIENVRAYDVGIGVRATFFSNSSNKSGANMFNSGRQSPRWTVQGCYVNGSTNKAVELQYVTASKINNLDIEACYDGPQFIGATASSMGGIRGTYKEAGISITEGAASIDISNFNLKAVAGGLAASSNSLGGFTVRREPRTDNITFTNINVSNGIIDATAATSGRAFTMSHHNNGAGGSACVIRGLTFSNVTMLGTVCLRDTASGSSPALVYRVTFTGGTIDALETSSSSISGLKMVGVTFVKATTNAMSYGIWSNNHFESDFTFTGTKNRADGNVIQGTFTKGSGNSIGDNYAGGSWVAG